MNIESSELAKLAEGWAPELVEEAVRATQVAAALDLWSGLISLIVAVILFTVLGVNKESWVDQDQWCDDGVKAFYMISCLLVATSAAITAASLLLNIANYYAIIDPQAVLVINLLSL